MNQGMGNFAYAGWIMNGLTNPKQVIRIDYDEDGYEDILEFDPSNPGNGQGGWLRLRNNHNGGFDVNGWAVTGLTEPVASFAFDYNNDGRKDILEFDPSSPGNGKGGWLRFMNTGNGNFAYAGWIMNGLTNPKQVITLDYDEDGYEDILQFDPSNPGNGQGGWLRLRNNHNGGFDVNGWAVTGLTPPVAALAFDYNNDGRKDILEFDPSSPGNGKGGWLRFMNTGNGNFAYAGWIMNGLTNPKQVVSFDYDDDGYKDIIQFDPSNPGGGQGGWLRLHNNHNGGFDVSGWAVTGLTEPKAVL